MKIAVVMDPISKINYKKDSTLLLLNEAQKRNHQLFYIEPQDLFFKGDIPSAICSDISVKMNPENWFALENEREISIKDVDVVLMRQDPPFDMEYVVNTYILEAAEQEGVHVINKPSTLRSFNEKISILEYLEFCTETIVSSNRNIITNFIKKNKKVVLKPLNLMGGQGVIKLDNNDKNLQDNISNATENHKQKVMVQTFIDKVYEGDRRILIIDGMPSQFAVVRTPSDGEFRGNLAAGGIATTEILNDRDKFIAKSLSSDLIKRGVSIAGIDIVGGYLTEINITCPTCFRELQDQQGINLASNFFDYVESLKV
ncbi:glutathione synthase [SAR86 cluster bacterium]|nr:glutathione synthase [SAR86 cluster bacterium]